MSSKRASTNAQVPLVAGGTGAPTAAGARTNLGLGTLATQSGTFSGTSSGTNTGDQTLSSLGAAPSTVPYLVTTADSGLSAEVVVPAAVLTVLDDATVAAMVDTLGGASSTGTGGLVRTTSPVLVTPALGTPASGVATNLTGTAASLTAGTVTTNANLTGDVTSSGNATTLATVTVAKGGTGSTTAAAARTALGEDGTVRDILPTGALFQSCPRSSSRSVAFAALSTARLQLYSIYIPTGVLLTSISFLSTGTALSVGVNQWFALFNNSLGKLRVTSDDTSTAWAGNTVKTLNLASTYTTTYSGQFYVGILVKATTVPTLYHADTAGLLGGLTPALSGTSTTGLTDPASCPDPPSAPGSPTVVPMAYFYVS